MRWRPTWGQVAGCTHHVMPRPHAGVPLPPDPEDPATEAAARATKSEHFVLMQSFGEPPGVCQTSLEPSLTMFH